MVVLAASIITSKSGKALLSRQFVDMPRVRIQGYLAAFPKLVGIGKQHIYVETEDVRYVYQPIESVYLLLVTSKQSNILEDLETLRLLSKIVPECSYCLDEESICKASFEIVFAFDEVINSLGHTENLTVAQVKRYCEMDSHEERLNKLLLQRKINATQDYMKRKARVIYSANLMRDRDENGFLLPEETRGTTLCRGGFGNNLLAESKGYKQQVVSGLDCPPNDDVGMQLGKPTDEFLESLKAEGEVTTMEDVRPSNSSSIGRSTLSAPPTTDPVTLTVEEVLNASLKQDGRVQNFDVQGTLALQIPNQQIQTNGSPDGSFKTHPKVNKELFSGEKILALKDPNQPFPTGQAGDGVSPMRWRVTRVNQENVPLSIDCWASDCGSETYVKLEYEAPFDLQNVAISIPLLGLREAPKVQQIDGEWGYNSKKSVLEWSIALIDNSNRRGTMELVIPTQDTSDLLPFSFHFTCATSFSDLQAADILPLKDGNLPKFAQRNLMSTGNYLVV